MKLRALLLLLALPAWANDAPRRLHAFPVSAGHVVTEPAWLYTDEGKARVDARLQADAQRIENLEKRNAALEAEPTLTAKGALLLVGSGVLLGLVLSVPIVLAARR